MVSFPALTVAIGSIVTLIVSSSAGQEPVGIFEVIIRSTFPFAKSLFPGV